ncbi:Mediator of RNA polymerase II transcription subunit 25, von Willebrand factor type A domain [Dillenia turbinata]|uniref:Mediator of RNA polymerase II transcription subunit 25 n=1 Tax=Dillenia turbinata TaxID=194707 RepID=A0AAN8VKN2_9MAGN
MKAQLRCNLLKSDFCAPVQDANFISSCTNFVSLDVSKHKASCPQMLVASNGSQKNADGRHCILVAASNPYPLATPVYRPRIQMMDQGETVEGQSESLLSDAETLAKSFPQCGASLSVICPRKLPKLRSIYNAGKCNLRSIDPPINAVKNPHYLVLISENFSEARAALSQPGVTNMSSNQSPVKMDNAPVAPVSGPPPTSLPPANGSVMNRQLTSVGNMPTATVKVEPTTVTSMVSGPGFPHIPSVPCPPAQGVPTLQTSSPASQDVTSNADSVPDLKPIITNMPQSLRPVSGAAANVSILNNLSQARQVMNSAALTGGTSIGLSSMGGAPIGIHVSNMISSGMASSVPPAQTVFSSGQSNITSITGSGTLAGTAQVAQNPPPGSFASANSSLLGNSNLGISQTLSHLQAPVSVGQSVPGISQGNLSGAPMVQSGIGMNQNLMSGLGPSGISSGTGTMIPTPGIGQQVQLGMQPLGVNNSSAASMPMSQQTSSALQSAQSKYVRVWGGNLSGQRQGQPVFITRLEGYRSASASETLAANWPETMQIVRLISQDHMNNKQYVGKADFLVFRAMHQHGFLGQLQEKKLVKPWLMDLVCAVIQLPSQTLLLSVSDKACRLIGMLFPGKESEILEV